MSEATAVFNFQCFSLGGGAKHSSSRKLHGNCQMTLKANAASSGCCHFGSSFKELDFDRRGEGYMTWQLSIEQVEQ